MLREFNTIMIPRA